MGCLHYQRPDRGILNRWNIRTWLWLAKGPPRDFDSWLARLIDRVFSRQLHWLLRWELCRARFAHFIHFIPPSLFESFLSILSFELQIAYCEISPFGI
ncbi:MAG: hypothetical protein HFI89_08700 [Lachnospiraceae bacterium]|nr:hypothetical protein [Lachnospiraceae bacterium]